VITDVLDPAFVRAHLDRVARVSRTLHPEDIQAAYRELDVADAARAAQPPASPGAGWRPTAPFIPRSPTLSLLQSMLEMCIESRAKDIVSDVESGSPLGGRSLQIGDVFRRFGPCDPLWIEAQLAEALVALRHPAHFNDHPAPPVTIEDTARVVIVGDWGTGLPAALAVAEQIASLLESGVSAGLQQHVIHLGDVYYAGFRDEYDKRFLAHWPVSESMGGVSSWSLNGNHDMYSGGRGYFHHLLREPRFAAHQGSSFFSLENAAWQLLGLDSAYRDFDLVGHQSDWVEQRLGGSSKKTILLSHHQAFSAHDKIGDLMAQRLADAFAHRPVDAWLWGHEHRCYVYRPGAGNYVKYAACIGHGGVPTVLSDADLAVPDTVAWQLNEFDLIGEDRWGRCGFAVLDFDGPRLQVRYIDQTGTLNHTDVID